MKSEIKKQKKRGGAICDRPWAGASLPRLEQELVAIRAAPGRGVLQNQHYTDVECVVSLLSQERQSIFIHTGRAEPVEMVTSLVVREPHHGLV
jgi:hypothetical protein